ncbi:hypothetical protein CY35_12G073400 [Sphagnum magellanicum]|nr:hypothetical protein CY35_12G073400 [Sphagnum magellanicum]
MQQSAIAVCNLPTLFRTPDSTLQRTSFWDYSQMVGSHISEGRDRQSFLNTARWVEEVRSERGSDVIIMLVGNKTDLVEKRQVSIEEGDAKAREFGVMFIETSAKAGFNIKALFRKIAAALPGMEALSAAKQDDLVDINLKTTSSTMQTESRSSGCAC